MKRIVFAARRSGFVAIVVLAVLAAGSATAAQVSSSQTRARLSSFVCQRALDPVSRAVSVTAVMRPLTATKRMSLRFELLSRSKLAGPYSAIIGGDLGSWISPTNQTLGRRSGDVWILTKQVVSLAAPATYRFRVFFRWIGARGRVLGTDVRETPTCAQPELRPDLLVQSVNVTAIANEPQRDLYTATIRNGGVTAAGPFEVLFSPGGGTAVKTRNVTGLGPHAKRHETFVGPACTSASAPTVTVDPNDQVDDYDRANNSLTVICPGA